MSRVLGEEQEVPLPASIRERLDREQQQQHIQLRTSQTLATQSTPDQEVEVQSLAEKTHLAPDIVRRNIELVRKKAARNDLTLPQLQRDSPKTAEYLSIPSNAAISKDDHHSLVTMEQIMSVPRSIVSSLAGPVVGRTLIGASEAVNIASRNLYPLIPPFLGQPLEEFLRQAGEEWQFRAQVHAPAQQNIVTEVVGGLSQFVPPVLTTALGHPELVPLMFGAQGLAAKKEDIQRIAAEKTLKGQPAPAPSPQAEDIAKLANAIVFGATGEFGLNKLLKPVEQLLTVTPPSLRGRLLQYVGDVSLTGSRQGVVMAVQSMLSNVITKIAIDHDQEITKGLWQDLKVGGITGAIARILLRQAGMVMPPQDRKAMDALEGKTQLQELSAAVKESKTQGRRPENVAAHVENVTANEKHYLSAKAILKYAEEKNLDPAKVADEITANGSDKVAETMAGGEDVLIPISDYTQRVANFDHQVFYDDNVRRGSPEAMTAIEAKEYFKKTAEPPTPEEQAQQQERQTILEQLQSPEVEQAIETTMAAARAAEPTATEPFLDRVAREARERIQKRGVRLPSGLDPSEFGDYVILSGAEIAKGVRDFTVWSRHMVDEFGDRVRPYLQNLYVKAVIEAHRSMGLTAAETKESLESLTVDALLAQAETETGAGSLYTTAELAKMTPEEFTAHQAIANKADDQRRAKLASAIRKSVERQRTADREAIEAQVRPQIEGQHDYQALMALKTKTMPDGSPLPKLDTAALKQMYGEFSQSPERQALKKLDLYRDQGGVHPDIAAEKLGYQSGDEMVQRLIALPPMEDAIRDAVDAQLRERYPDMLATGEARREARNLANQVGRSDVIEADLRRLAAQIPETPKIAQLAQEQQREATKAGLAAVTRRPSFLTKREARKNAEAEVASMRVREITPGLYSAAAQREAKAAIDAFAAGDLQGALAAKQRELVSVERYRAATNARIEAEKIADNQRSYDRPAKRARIAKSGQYYIDRIDAYRDGADFARVTNKALDKQESLQAFVAREIDKAQPVDAATLAAVKEGKSYRDMTLDELRQLNAAVEHVNHLSKLKTDLMTSTAERDFDENRDDIVASIVESQPRVRKDPRITGFDDTFAYKAMDGFHRWNAAHRAASSLAFELDGFREGPFRKALIHPGTDAGLRQAQLENEFVERITPLFAPVVALGGMKGRGQYFPSINRSLNRTKRIVLALQMGTETGEQRLLGGDGWTRVQVQPVLDSLSRVELDLVQGIFDHFETYVKEAGELERRTTGNEVEWLERTPIVTANGTIPGGYYPVKYDLRRSSKAQRQADAAAGQDLLQGAYTGATTRQSYLKSRVPEVYNRPIDLASFRGLFQGTHEVIHDLAFRPFLIDANRIIRDPQVETAIRDRKGSEGLQIFTTWIEDAARGDAQAQTIIDRATSYAVRGVTTATLAFRLASGLKQLPDLAFAASRIGKGWVARAVMQSMSSPKETYTFVNEDPLMKERGGGALLQRDIEAVRKEVQGESPVKQAIYGSFFIFNRIFQQMVDVPTYLAQYNKSFAAHGDEVQARREARQAVIDTQGSSEKQNLPEVMRRGNTKRLLTMFYHGFAIQHQAAAERTQRGIRVFQREGVSTKSAAEAVSLATDYLMIYGAQAAMGAAIRHWFYNRDDESWAKTLIREGLQGLIGEQVLLREFEGPVEKILELEEYQRDYQGPAAFRFIVALENLATQADQGEWDKAYRHAVVNGLAMASGGRIPGSQTNATLDAIIALWEGETENPFTLISGPPQE